MIEIGLAVAAVVCLIGMHKLLPQTQRYKENKLIRELKAIRTQYNVDEFHLVDQDGAPSYIIQDRYGKEFVVDVKYLNKRKTKFVLVDRYPTQEEIDELKVRNNQTSIDQ